MARSAAHQYPVYVDYPSYLQRFSDQIRARCAADGKDGKDGKDGSPDTGDQIVRKINTASDKIDASRIKNLPKPAYDDYVRRGSRKMGRGQISPVMGYDLSTQLNGSLKVFTIPSHSRAIALIGTQFPIVYRPTTDWVASGTTLTLTSEVTAPEAGQTLILLYSE